MSSTTSPKASKVTLCSTVSLASGEDPAGSAWALRRIMLVELPLPWPENVLRARHAPAGLEELLWELYAKLESPWGMIGIAPDPAYSIAGLTRIIDLRQGEALAGTYHRDSYLVPPDETVRFLRLLSFEPEHPDLTAHREPDDQATRDLLVCTHGAVDACCAAFGYPMYQLLRAMADRSGTPTRVWRCTHFGGHRFAATALEAPQGRYWGHLEAGMLAKLVHRNAPARDLRRYYRGWAALAEPLWQVAEAELLAAAGWEWLDVTVTGIHGEATAEAGGTLTIGFAHPSVSAGAVDVAITPAGTVQTMDASKSGELRAAPQYQARIVAQRPAGCLDAIAGR